MMTPLFFLGGVILYGPFLLCILPQPEEGATKWTGILNVGATTFPEPLSAGTLSSFVPISMSFPSH